MEEKSKKKSRFSEDDEQPTLPPIKKRFGKVESIRNGWIIVDVNGNGEQIKFDEKIHSGLKAGDKIEL